MEHKFFLTKNRKPANEFYMQKMSRIRARNLPRHFYQQLAWTPDGHPIISEVQAPWPKHLLSYQMLFLVNQLCSCTSLLPVFPLNNLKDTKQSSIWNIAGIFSGRWCILLKFPKKIVWIPESLWTMLPIIFSVKKEQRRHLQMLSLQP